MKFEEKEIEIILIALSDFRLKNMIYFLFEDEKIRDLIVKFLKCND